MIVYLINCEELTERGNVCMKRIEYLNKHPLPTFAWKYVQKGKGEVGVGGGEVAYFRDLVVQAPL